MGVSGSGKSSVMREVADRLGWAWAEGDEFHPASNIEKMRAGHPLTDADRRPWLEAIAAWIGEQEAAGRNAVLTCSALKRSYRDVLRQGHPSVWFVHLVAPGTVIEGRVEHRRHAYMPASLLESQLGALEPLQSDEPGVTISTLSAPERVVDDLLDRLHRR